MRSVKAPIKEVLTDSQGYPQGSWIQYFNALGELKGDVGVHRWDIEDGAYYVSLGPITFFHINRSSVGDTNIPLPLNSSGRKQSFVDTFFEVHTSGSSTTAPVIDSVIQIPYIGTPHVVKGFTILVPEV